MTKLEKTIICDALKAYQNITAELENIYRAQGDVERAVKYSMLSTQAKAILTYWPDVVNLPCGTVKI